MIIEAARVEPRRGFVTHAQDDRTAVRREDGRRTGVHRERAGDADAGADTHDAGWGAGWGAGGRGLPHEERRHERRGRGREEQPRQERWMRARAAGARAPPATVAESRPGSRESARAQSGPRQCRAAAVAGRARGSARAARGRQPASPSGRAAKAIGWRSTAAKVSDTSSLFEQLRPRQHLVEHDAKRPHVRALVDDSAARLFRRHIGSRAENRAERGGPRGQRRRAQRVGARRLVHDLGEPEIEHLHGAIVDVRRPALERACRPGAGRLAAAA